MSNNLVNELKETLRRALRADSTETRKPRRLRRVPPAGARPESGSIIPPGDAALHAPESGMNRIPPDFDDPVEWGRIRFAWGGRPRF